MVKDCSTVAPAGKLNGLASRVKSKLARNLHVSGHQVGAIGSGHVDVVRSADAVTEAVAHVERVAASRQADGSVLGLLAKFGEPLATSEPLALVTVQLVSPGRSPR